MSSDATADVAVIGAGIVGAAAAFRLAEAGAGVIVLEAADAPATGSTGKSAAGVRVQFSEAVNVELSWASIQEYRAFHDLYGASSGYDPLGYLFLVPDEHAAAYRASVDLQRRLGAPVAELEPAEARTLVPFVADGVAMATFGSADGVIDPHAVTLTYLAMAKRHGARVLVGSPVRSAAWDGSAWRLGVAEAAAGAASGPGHVSRTVSAGMVVNAAGAWAGDVAAQAGLRVPVVPMLRSIYATAPLSEPHRYPLTIDVASGYYLRSEGRRVIMGRSNLEQPPGFFEGVDMQDLERVAAFGMARFPWLAAVGLDRRASWWGYYEVTPDDQPIIGRMPPVAPGASDWLNACGFSGHGVQQAAMVGRLIAEEALRGSATSLDIAPLRYERFLGANGEFGAIGRRELNIV
ncbi:MAG TPA: FAD-dependent oxidoreductase [Trueperaceae bacterium]|nr:FAD-dependent oxidoreductase [Trueperaceae bacterium]